MDSSCAPSESSDDGNLDPGSNGGTVRTDGSVETTGGCMEVELTVPSPRQEIGPP